MDDFYRENILDHYRNPRNSGHLESPSATAEGVCVRAGHHCTQPAMRHFGLVATARASMYLYNTVEDMDALAAGLAKVKRTFGV
jgi:selenocysteine lyase/cysteine desulfurase